MSAPAAAGLLLVAFLALDALGGRLPPRWRRAPLALLALALAAAGFEMARYDHGRGDLLLWIAFVAAPVVVIFGGAAAGARRWYGWPDLGPLPGRAAAVGAALLLGVLLGARVRESDLVETMERGRRVAVALRAWRDGHGGSWPPTLADALGEVPATRLGSLAPPPFAYDPAAHRLSFPVRTGASLSLDLGSEDARWK